MFTASHADDGVKSLMDTVTDMLTEDAGAGWDARIRIHAPGTDPFEKLDDDELLEANPGVLAAVVLAQANQMRVLDSAIIPDGYLVRPTTEPAGRFNEFEVYTPATSPERYAVIRADGSEEVIVPSAKFYPGLAEREDSAQSAISLDLAEETSDPYAIALATGTALLQIGVECGYDVSNVAEVLNRAWGVADLFTPATVVGLAGTRDYAALYAQDRNTNARRLASWQNCSLVRSGQLAMSASDWGPMLHADFRRIRVAAESLFAGTVVMETTARTGIPRGKITYHVPATSLLCADPQYLFFADADPSVISTQPRCAAADHLLEMADRIGLLRALWRSAEPTIAATWAASFQLDRGLASVPVVYHSNISVGAAVYAAATNKIIRPVRSLASGIGRTPMTALSAKLSKLADGVTTVQDVAWLSRFAAVIEIMRLSTDKDDRIEMAKEAWSALAGGIPRALENSTSPADMREMHRCLPATMRGSFTAASAKVPVMALLLELGSPATAKEHTVLRGLRRAFAKSADVAKAATVAEKGVWVSGPTHEWIAPRLAVLREYWAVQFAALGQVAGIAQHLRSDLRWWVEVSAAVNTFRAGVMRGFKVVVFERERAGSVVIGPAQLYCNPYHAAAHLRKSLATAFPVEIPAFTASEFIAEWADVVSIVTAPFVAKEVKNIPRAGKGLVVADMTSHFTRGASLLGVERALGGWVRDTVSLVADDVLELITWRSAILTAARPPETVAVNPQAALSMVRAYEEMAESLDRIRTMAPPGDLYGWIEEESHEDAWDNFVEAAYDDAHPAHALAARQLEVAKATTDRSVAASIASWIATEFRDEEDDTGAAVM
jgi:hypothetical protein